MIVALLSTKEVNMVARTCILSLSLRFREMRMMYSFESGVGRRARRSASSSSGGYGSMTILFIVPR